MFRSVFKVLLWVYFRVFCVCENFEFFGGFCIWDLFISVCDAFGYFLCICVFLCVGGFWWCILRGIQRGF